MLLTYLLEISVASPSLSLRRSSLLVILSSSRACFRVSVSFVSHVVVRIGTVVVDTCSCVLHSLCIHGVGLSLCGSV
ncbi:hypothetical protein HanHA300_Chr10g0377201 [Helianthus annuus]|nr:hypothetical protein HanHA300_Chr10g0377201 [Helianthus annuus]KAJ0531303.1 hypothetical protein HanHA89_Chr10g0399631 [Helianthus annuus]KAJ0698139.1 hypothetical protein HanLR1_Chr10g0376821 [Helianthus annuus]